MSSFNKVLLMGNLTRDPQLSYTPNQTAVVDFGLAVNRKWTSRDGEKKEETCFVDCRAFGRTAENINKYMSKGRPLFVEGRLTFDSWTSQDGTKRSKHRVTVENFQFLPGGQRQDAGQNEQSAAPAASRRKQEAEAGSQAEKQYPDSVDADDIPF
ncbi:MAG TPA: single-stranded DNA-binding protein [Planctomycetes bacterium]|nr:single-stranded DNA-binding protein [Planctomycetota bacterium]